MSSEFAPARLSQEMEVALRSLMTTRSFPDGATLYQQGTAATGVYLVESGVVRVLLSTADNQNQLLEVVGTGTILGLSEALSADNYRVTVEASEPTVAAFLDRQSLVDFLDTHNEFCMEVVRLLSEDLHSLYHKFRNVSAHPGRPRRRLPNEQLN